MASEKYLRLLMNRHVREFVPVPTPRDLIAEFPHTNKSALTVINARKTIEDILDGKDSRIIALVGPCSIHDIEAGKEYARKIKKFSNKVSDKIFIGMRTYFEKTRTCLGWEGLLSDPDINGTYDLAKGLRQSRELLLYNAKIGLPSATEYSDPLIPQYTGDLVSWAAVGARAVQAPRYRQLASGLSMPVGLKNNTEGNVQFAVDAILSSREKHGFFGISELGSPVGVKSTGHPHTHLVLRGSDKDTNYDEKSVKTSQRLLESRGLSSKLMIDCSHGNSEKNHGAQAIVCKRVVQQIRNGNKDIIGVMLESNLKSGNQPIPEDLTGFDKSTLKYGVSITDPCLSWEATEMLLLDVYRSL